MRDDENISRDVQEILKDYSNLFYVSSVAVQELIHAYKTRDIEDVHHKSVKDLFHSIEAAVLKLSR
jgi:hypothetical protein